MTGYNLHFAEGAGRDSRLVTWMPRSVYGRLVTRRNL